MHTHQRLNYGLSIARLEHCPEVLVLALLSGSIYLLIRLISDSLALQILQLNLGLLATTLAFINIRAVCFVSFDIHGSVLTVRNVWRRHQLDLSKPFGMRTVYGKFMHVVEILPSEGEPFVVEAMPFEDAQLFLRQLIEHSNGNWSRVRSEQIVSSSHPIRSWWQRIIRIY